MLSTGIVASQRLGYKNPSSTSLWAWWDAAEAYTETSGTPTTLITSDATAIGSLKDRSGNGRHLYQATAGNKPLYKTSIINGLPIVRIAASDFMATNAAIPASGGTYSAHCVVIRASFVNLGYIIGSNDNGGGPIMLGNGNTANGSDGVDDIFHGGVVGDAKDNGNFTPSLMLLSCMGRPGAPRSALKINNAMTVTGTFGLGTGGTQVQIGRYGGSASWLGDIAEVLYYSGVDHSDFTSGDGLQARRYLDNKYALGLGL